MSEVPMNRHPRFARTLGYSLSLLLVVTWQSLLAQQVQAQFDFGGLGGFGQSASDSQVTLEAEFTPATADRPALLFVTANVAAGFHVYAVDQGNLPDGGGGPMPTQLSIDGNPTVQPIGPWQAIEQPSTHVDQDIWKGLELREHSHQVSWFVPIQLSEGASPASLTIAGEINGQACNADNCIPFTYEFTAKLGEGIALPESISIQVEPVANSAPAPPTTESTQPLAAPPTTLQPLASAPASANLYDLSKVSLRTDISGSLSYYLLTAFLGGLILNVMPCVLPVIGLKVMSFVQQAGQSRAHAFALNVWYAAGIISVFMALACLAVTLDIGWGTQFSSSSFNIVLLGIVFAMALSLLGMWDIPIPGFVGSSAAVEVTEREGPTAAFLKGILTTLLATPCTGPLMAPALFWAVRQPASITFSIFAMLGLGMASPYLIIGAFPELIRFLPKPGAWMENFKKVMGLILLATVVWLLTFIDSPLVVPTVALMVGIATACWWVSQTPITAPLDQKAYSWVTAVMIVVITVMSSYGWLYRDVMKPRFEKKVAQFAEQQIGEDRLRIARDLGSIEDDQQLRRYIAQLAVSQGVESNDHGWQSFSLAKLGQLTLGEGRTVLVDFTADWCWTCKTLEKLVLKTQPVEEALTLADVVTMEADYTKYPEPIDRAIKALGGVGVPLIAIFPANDPYNPIVFSNASYTKSDIIGAIAQATGRKDLLEGPSASSATLSQSDSGESRR